MGPVLLIDKSTIQGLSLAEVQQLERFYSLLITPILMRELVSTLAKEQEPGKDWPSVLAALATKVDTLDSNIPAKAHSLAAGSLLGENVPLTGQIPLPGGKRIRARDGSYGVFFEEQEEKKILRRWKAKDFDEETINQAKLIRKLDSNIDLHLLQKNLSINNQYIPKFSSLKELVAWFDNYVIQTNPELQIRLLMQETLPEEKFSEVLGRWKKLGKPTFEKFAPYAFYYFRVMSTYYLGLAQNLISPSKSAKTHLDIQYVLYLPFSRCFVSNDKHLSEIAKLFLRPNQQIIDGVELKADLRCIKNHFEGLSTEEIIAEREMWGAYPPDLKNSVTLRIWTQLFGPRKKVKKERRPERSKLPDELLRVLNDSVDENNQTRQPRECEYASMSLIEKQLAFVKGVNQIIEPLGEWDDVRKIFSSEHVKRIYDLHASVWHPQDDFNKLAEDYRALTIHKTKYLYLGDIKPHDIVRSIFQLCGVFDQIIIVDPFNSPWIMNSERNPLRKPEAYETDTLQLVFLLVMISPLIAAEKVVLLPDVSNYNYKMKTSFYRLAEAERTGDKPILKDESFLNRETTRASLRVLCRWPKSLWRKGLKTTLGEGSEDGGVHYLESLRANDTITINRDSEKMGEIVINRAGSLFGIAILNARLYQAVPYRRFSFVSRHFTDQNPSLVSFSTTNGHMFQEIETFNCPDPEFISAVLRAGLFKDMRNFFERLIMLEKFSSDGIEEIMTLYREELVVMAEEFASKIDTSPERLINNEGFKLWHATNGFSALNAEEPIKKFFPDLAEQWPKFYIELPPFNTSEEVIT